MEKMTNYILGGLYATERAISNINQNLTQQARFNGKVRWFMLTTGVYIWLGSKYYKQQRDKIAGLENEIKELKAKGE